MTKILWLKVSLIYIVGFKAHLILFSMLVILLKSYTGPTASSPCVPYVVDTRNQLDRINRKPLGTVSLESHKKRMN